MPVLLLEPAVREDLEAREGAEGRGRGIGDFRCVGGGGQILGLLSGHVGDRMSSQTPITYTCSDT